MTKDYTCSCRDQQLDEELADVLIAISVVSKRLAHKLNEINGHAEPNKEGGKKDGQNE